MTMRSWRANRKPHPDHEIARLRRHIEELERRLEQRDRLIGQLEHRLLHVEDPIDVGDEPTGDYFGDDGEPWTWADLTAAFRAAPRLYYLVPEPIETTATEAGAPELLG